MRFARLLIAIALFVTGCQCRSLCLPCRRPALLARLEPCSSDVPATGYLEQGPPFAGSELPAQQPPTATEQVVRLSQDVESLQEQKTRLEQDVDYLKRELAAHQTALADAEQAVQTAHADIDRVTDQLNQWRQLLDELEREVGQSQHENANALEELSSRLERLIEQSEAAGATADEPGVQTGQLQLAPPHRVKRSVFQDPQFQKNVLR